MITLKKVRGFSLVEILVAMLIIIIMGMAAIPYYLDSIKEARRHQGRSALYQVLMQEERFFMQHHTYAVFDANRPHPIFKWWSGDDPQNSYYEISATSCGRESLTACVLLLATPGTYRVGPFEDTVCGQLGLDSRQHRTDSSGIQSNKLCW